MRCADCKWKYPSGFLNEMHINGTYSKAICGICALRISNSFTQSPRTHFAGQVAESLRLAAIKWREEHPADKPE